MKKRKLKKNFSVIFLLLTLTVSLLTLYYYQYYPRYSLGYSDTKVSKNTWEKASSGFSDYASSLYYKRFENEYNYKAYLIYVYYNLIGFMSKKETPHSDILARISCAEINNSDKNDIDALYCQYREYFLNILKNYHPSQRESEVFYRSLVALYFFYYYNYECNGLIMNKKEFIIVLNWLKFHDSELVMHLRDPFNLRSCDFSELIDSNKLRNYIAMDISSEFLLDMKKYENWIDKFYYFCSNNSK